MTFDLGGFLLGLAFLYLGAEWLVRGAGRLAERWGLPPLVAGLTLVAFGTSAPELVVTGLASFRGEGSLATGNVVGSNIANVALILGLAALVRPLRVMPGLMVRDIPLLVACSVLIPLLAWNGWVGRWEAALLVCGFAAYMAYLMREGDAPGEEGLAAGRGAGHDYLLVLAGTAALAGGAHLMIIGATGIARDLGIPEVVIGTTLVAFGTSVPELAASTAAAARGKAGIVLGNVVGSNIFNLTLILGAAALIRPLPFDPALFRLEVPVMAGLALLLLPLAWTRATVHRWEGAVLLAAYAGFLGWLFLR